MAVIGSPDCQPERPYFGVKRNGRDEKKSGAAAFGKAEGNNRHCEAALFSNGYLRLRSQRTAPVLAVGRVPCLSSVAAQESAANTSASRSDTSRAMSLSNCSSINSAFLASTSARVLSVSNAIVCAFSDRV